MSNESNELLRFAQQLLTDDELEALAAAGVLRGRINMTQKKPPVINPGNTPGPLLPRPTTIKEHVRDTANKVIHKSK